MNPLKEHIQRTRRNFLTSAASGIGSIALHSMMAHEAGATSVTNPLAPKMPHFAPTAKRCIFLFMAGAPSQVDLFSYKPKLNEMHGEKLPDSLLKEMRFAFIEKETAVLMGTKAKFKRHGQSGMWFSDYLPHIARHADDICMINTMHTEEFNHHPGQLMMQCGDGAFGLPTMGSWLSYGLGTENQSLPGYVVLTSGRGASAGSTIWQSGFLPSIYEGVRFRTRGEAVLNLANPAGLPDALQRAGLDALATINQAAFSAKLDAEIASRISNYELAYRMQTSAPDLIDLSQEKKKTLEMYGVERRDPEEKGGRNGSAGPDQYRSFASNCLLARRMVERGVRFVNIVHATWDHHSELDRELTFNAGMADQPVAARVRSRGIPRSFVGATEPQNRNDQPVGPLSKLGIV